MLGMAGIGGLGQHGHRPPDLAGEEALHATRCLPRAAGRALAPQTHRHGGMRAAGVPGRSL